MRNFSNSSDQIEFGSNYVLKKAGDPSRARFVRAQAKMMQEQALTIKEFQIPKITEIGKDSYRMERVHGITAFEFFSIACKDSCLKLSLKILEYLSSRRMESFTKLIQKRDFSAKVGSVLGKLDVLDRRLENVFSIGNEIKSGLVMYAPLSSCHGDMTLSNILVTPAGDYLIDPLEPLVTTYWLDLVKLEQEIDHGWSALLAKERGIPVAYDRAQNMIQQTLRPLYRAWLSTEENVEEMKPFRILNLMRILPYTKEEGVLRHLVEGIEEEWERRY